MYDHVLSIKDLLESKVRSLSTLEAKLAAHLIEQPERWAFESASQLAEQLGVHRSTIVRFAQRLGFKGYPELQSFVRRGLRRILGMDPESIWGSMDGEDSVLKAVYLREQHNLQQTYALLDPKILNLTAKALAEAGNVLVFGRRFSYAIAFYLYASLRLMRNGVRIAPDPGGSTVDAIFDLGPNDYALIVSLRRHSPEIRRTIEFLCQAKVPCALLTDVSPAPLLPEGVRIIQAYIGSKSILDSYTALVSVVHALLSLTSLYIPDANKRAETLEQKWHQFNQLRIP